MSSTERPVPALAAGDMPLHRQLFLVLRDQIQRGTHAVGDALPTEEQLGRQYGVSRITVRRALQDLADQGWVERRHGRGTFVRAGHRFDEPAPMLSVIDALRRTQLETEAELVDLAVGPPPRGVARELGLPDGEPALDVLRVRREGEVPVMVTESWLPGRFADVVTAEALEGRALYELLLGAGVRLGRIVQEISAEVADPGRARLLEIGIGDPLLRLDRLVHDADGQPVQFLRLSMSPSRSRIVMEIPADRIDTATTSMVVHDV